MALEPPPFAEAAGHYQNDDSVERQPVPWGFRRAQEQGHQVSDSHQQGAKAG
jgi:hypothetical protein